jgi:hypothetical protein
MRLQGTQTVRKPSMVPDSLRWTAIAVLLGGMLAAVLSTSPATAASQAAVITPIDVSGMTFFNACTNESLTITSGTLHLVTQAVDTGAGGTHVTMRGSAQNVIATGEVTGTTYRLAGDFWTEQNGAADGSPFIVQLVELHAVISPGPDSNVIWRVLTHVTVNASGDISVSIDSVEIDCRG